MYNPNSENDSFPLILVLFKRSIHLIHSPNESEISPFPTGSRSTPSPLLGRMCVGRGQGRTLYCSRRFYRLFDPGTDQ